MSSIHLVNFPTKQRGFGFELKKALNQRDVSVELTESTDYLMDLGDGQKVLPKLMLHESEVAVSECLFFMKRRKPKPMYSSVFLQFVKLMKGQYLNSAFVDHHKNVDKQSQYINLIAHGFAIPRTMLVHGSEFHKYSSHIVGAFSFPLVVKAAGSGGKYVWKVNSIQEIDSLISRTETDRTETIVIQEFIEQSKEEYRVVLCLGEVQAIIIRSSTSFHNNYAQGGSVTSGILSEEDINLCKKVASISGLDYLGVDFIKTADGTLLFMELQTGPSMTVSKIVAPDIIESIAETLEQKLIKGID